MIEGEKLVSSKIFFVEMELTKVQISILISCFVQLINNLILFKKLNNRYGIGMAKRFPGEIVTYLFCTVSGK